MQDAQSSLDRYCGSLYSPDTNQSYVRGQICHLSIRLLFLTFLARNSPHLPGASQVLSLCSHWAEPRLLFLSAVSGDTESDCGPRAHNQTETRAKRPGITAGVIMEQCLPPECGLSHLNGQFPPHLLTLLFRLTSLPHWDTEPGNNKSDQSQTGNKFVRNFIWFLTYS